MAVFNIFSKRQKKERGELPDVYQYENISDQLRGQIVHILRDSLGRPEAYEDEERERAAFQICGILCREYGTFSLLSRERSTKLTELTEFILSEKNIEKCLDAIELSFRYIDVITRNHYNEHSGQQSPDDALKELNDRFLENGFGFQYENRELIRIDSKLLHQDVVKPTLLLLQNPIFKNANDEYMEAHRDYKNREFDDCIHKCAKSLETTMKIICKKRKWQYKETDSAKKLIEIVINNGLIPRYLLTHFNSFQQMLESGVPTIRNKDGGHGKGTKDSEIPDFLASFQLHQTAALISLLVQAENNL